MLYPYNSHIFSSFRIFLDEYNFNSTYFSAGLPHFLNHFSASVLCYVPVSCNFLIFFSGMLDSSSVIFSLATSLVSFSYSVLFLFPFLICCVRSIILGNMPSIYIIGTSNVLVRHTPSCLYF